MASTAIEGLATDVEQAIREFDAACETVSECVARLVSLQGERPRQKVEARMRLCAQENPATPGKNYTISQADDVLQLDPEYARYKYRVASAEAAVREAEDAKTSAFMLVQLRITVFKSEVGVT